MKERTYEHIRALAIVDAKRRLNIIKDKIPGWDILDKPREDKHGKVTLIEKEFWYNPQELKFTNITLNEYAMVREIKYIVWRFEITKKELVEA